MSNAKRRDNKGRVLQMGEWQQDDGRYVYRYMTPFGQFFDLHLLHWEKYFRLSVEKYNSIYRVQLPKITPHVCRHAFCTNMAKFGMNPKVLQYIMGHGDISVTLDTYTHIKVEDAIAEMERLDLLTEKEA